MLRVERLSLSRSGRRVLRGVSFDLQRGEIVAIIGPNGAGKTSLLESVAGFHRLEAGRVTFRDRPLATFGDRAAVFSFMPDAAEPPAEVRVDALVRHALRFGDGQGLLDRLALAPLLSARAGELSRGEKRRLLLFTALCTRRPVVVLDEPLGVFDPLQLIDVLDLLRERARAGAALLVSIHQLADAEKLADRLLLLDDGEVIAFGTRDDLAKRAGKSTLEDVFLTLLEERNARA